jgi:hypothetical protein
MSYEHKTDGSLYTNIAAATSNTGNINTVSPLIGNIHASSNYSKDSMAISIQAYGTNIGATQRHVFDLAAALPKDFVSDYVADAVPNLWNLSKAICTNAATFLNLYVAIACGRETRSHIDTDRESWHRLRSNRSPFAAMHAASRDDERDGDLAALGEVHYEKQPQDSSTRTPRPNVGGCPKPH